MTDPRSTGLILLAALLASPAVAHARDEDSDEVRTAEATEETDGSDAGDTDETGDAEPDATAEESTDASPPLVNHRESSGLGFELSLGGLAAFRRMEFAGSEHTVTHEPGFYVGGVLHGSQHIWTFDSNLSHVLIEAEAGFGSAKNAEPEPALGRPLTTEHTYLQALGILEKPLNSTLDLRVGLGASALSFTVEPNPDYTGHRYLSIVAHFGAVKWFEGPLRAGGAITFFPSIDTNQSARDYGSARAFGARAEAFGTMRFYQPDEGDLFGTAEVEARYSLTRWRTAMPETQAVGERAGTDDTQHILVLMLNYYL